MPKLDKIAKKKKKSFCLSGTILFVNKKKTDQQKTVYCQIRIVSPKNH